MSVVLCRWMLVLATLLAAGPRLRAASTAEAALAAGEAVLVYPEGTIPRAGQVMAAQPGVGWLALRSGAPVLPVASLGMERVAPAVRLREWLARGLRRRPVRVAVGTPVPLDDLRQSHLRGSADRAEPSVLARLAAERCLAAVRSLQVSPAPPSGPGR